ncbi:unnamed protein product, partial [marine sediment metagenome]
TDLSFDQDGVCNYCHQHDVWDGQHQREGLFDLVKKIKGSGSNGHDCVVGVSGGVDSSYLLYLAKALGLRPIAVHYHNGWDKPVAISNMAALCLGLDVPLYRVRLERKITSDIWRKFFLSGSSDLEAPTDIAIAAVLYEAAAKSGVRYILSGHNFRTEGYTPKCLSYMDGRYIRGIAGDVDGFDEYPNLTLWKWLKWMLRGIKVVRPLWHIRLSKEQMVAKVGKDISLGDYGQHHAENDFTEWFAYYYRPEFLGWHGGMYALSANVRSGFLNRDDALKKYGDPK